MCNVCLMFNHCFWLISAFCLMYTIFSGSKLKIETLVDCFIWQAGARDLETKQQKSIMGNVYIAEVFAKAPYIRGWDYNFLSMYLGIQAHGLCFVSEMFYLSSYLQGQQCQIPWVVVTYRWPVVESHSQRRCCLFAPAASRSFRPLLPWSSECSGTCSGRQLYLVFQCRPSSRSYRRLWSDHSYIKN